MATQGSVLFNPNLSEEAQALLDMCLDLWGLKEQTALFVEIGVEDVDDLTEYVLDSDIEEMNMSTPMKCAALDMLKSLRAVTASEPSQENA